MKVAVVLALCLPCAGYAQSQAQSQAQNFKSMDLNGDGFVDAKENESYAASSFRQMDRNKDGFLDGAEVSAYLQQQIAAINTNHVPLPPQNVQQAAVRWINMMDANGDGNVSEAEYRSWTLSRAQSLDKDHDGKISLAEFPGTKGP